MTVTKSKKYRLNSKGEEGTGTQYSFNFDKNNNLIGINEGAGRNGQYRETPLDPSSDLFTTLANSESALEAMNVNKFKGKTTQSAMQIASADELSQHYNNKTKKRTNENIDVKPNDTTSSANVAPSNFGIGDPFSSYKRDPRKETYATVLAYPLDIDPQQDHLKITKYAYTRTSVQASRGARTTTETISGTKKVKRKLNKQQKLRGFSEYTSVKFSKEVDKNIAGDSVKGKERLGSVILPMPKVVDTNGCEWGESKLNIFGLAAVSAGQELGKLGVSKETQDEIAAIQKQTKDKKTSGLKDLAGVTGAAAFSQGAALAGIEIDQNAFLARTSGRVLNPNAELLFQGPVLRDFNFDFLMIARSRAEGEEIRRIIRWFKLGMAPRFNSSTFLTTPDVFQLEYKRGQGPQDHLDTVNRFSPGGLALRTVAVDYSPSGYWSAYQDSQPVAVKMSLNFAELRPIYQGDQEMTPETSVGY
tara:strand:+ start:75 stop:1496 length:1422 start_codon:yes stop_codon:yes gene_type:complete